MHAQEYAHWGDDMLVNLEPWPIRKLYLVLGVIWGECFDDVIEDSEYFYTIELNIGEE